MKQKRVSEFSAQHLIRKLSVAICITGAFALSAAVLATITQELYGGSECHMGKLALVYDLEFKMCYYVFAVCALSFLLCTAGLALLLVPAKYPVVWIEGVLHLLHTLWWLIAASIITAAYNQSKGGIGGGGGRYEHLYGLRPQSKAVVALAWFAMAWCIAPTIICFVFGIRQITALQREEDHAAAHVRLRGPPGVPPLRDSAQQTVAAAIV